LWLLHWYPICYVAVIIWLHFNSGVFINAIFSDHVALPVLIAVWFFSIGGRVALAASSLGLLALVVAGVKWFVMLSEAKHL
jgi:hypothetical protein